MRAVKTYAEVGSDKSLILKSLPFAPGSRVEVSEKIAWGPSISDGNVQIWEREFLKDVLPFGGIVIGMWNRKKGKSCKVHV